MSSSQQVCAAYETFGVCKFGRDCLRSHNVWPYRTETAVATIATEDINLPGVIAFLTKSGDENSRSQRYYISRGHWFSADSGSGDVVEISISEKVHQGSGCCCARICKILRSASTSRIPPLMPTGFSEQRDCLDFITYKHCTRGARCSFTHDVTSAFTQHFHVAKVLSVIPFRANSWEVHVDVKSDHVGPSRANGNRLKTYFVPDKFSCNVREGNLVIVQESSRLHEYTGMPYGKIMAILHNSQELGESEVALEVSAKSGFMFVLSHDFDGLQRTTANAYSMERCSYHENCRRIGVHIRAAALGMHSKKLDQYFVPHHRENIRNLPRGFEVDTIKLALTWYFHSASEEVNGPFLTPLFISSENAYNLNDRLKYQRYLEHMWPVFGAKSFIDDVVNSLAAAYVADFPETWKERYVIRQSLNFFNLEIAKYMQSKEGMFLIVRRGNVITGIKAQDVVISTESLEMVKSTWQSPATHSAEKREIALGFLLGSVKRSAEEFWEEQLLDRYTWEVVSSSNIQNNEAVISTSPIAQTVDFLNQQITLSVMISPLVSLYSKNDILGCINRRHHTPFILKAVIRQLTKTVVYLQFRGIFGRRRGNRELWLKEIFECPFLTFKSSNNQDSDACESFNEPVDKISLLLKDLSSEHYCNSKLVRLTGEQIATLSTTTIKEGVNSDKTTSNVLDLLATHEEYEAPYEVHENGTLVTLSRGVELQLQISLKEDNSNDGDHWLRLLRVGKDCHRCLLHSNVPIQAFFSGRGDTASLIPQSSLKLMQEKIASNSLRTVTLKEVSMEWNDCYFSGGTFTANTTIKPRNLLCIRKEMVGNDDQLIFVWTCHAVVSEVCESRIRFLVCSLFQDLTPEMWTEIENADFIVEVIDINEENVSDQ